MADKIDTTHVLMENELVVYRRERSNIWQCRYKVSGLWQRATTKEADLKKAKAKAKEIMVEAEIRKRSNLPVITRKFKSVALLAIQRMEQETASKKGKVSYDDYTRVINTYLIPFFGNRNITSIDYSVLDQFDVWRIERMRNLSANKTKAPANSTILTHNAALNRVLDEAVMRNFLTAANKPKLDAKGRAGDRRPGEQRVQRMKANAKAAKIKAGQLKDNADISADILKQRQMRQKAAMAQKKSVSKMIKPYK